MFSVGDYELNHDLALFRGGNQRRKKGMAPVASSEGKRPMKGAPRPTTAPAPSTPSGNVGTRKSHIRNVRGKAVMIGQSILKAGRNTADKLAISGKNAAGQLATGVKNNPKAAALIGGGTVLAGGGAGFLLTRPKRARR